jgi:hypothetical protein
MKSTTTQVIKLNGRETSGNSYKARLRMALLDVAYEKIDGEGWSTSREPSTWRTQPF